MQLQLNSLPVCNQNTSHIQCELGSSRSVISVKNSDPTMITSAANREHPATIASACTTGSRSNPSADLNDALYEAVSRQDGSQLSSRQSRMLFSFSSGAAAEHERGGWCPRCYACSFCGREFNSAQALGGHMNIHRRDRARLRTSSSSTSTAPDQAEFPPIIQNSAPSCHDSLNSEAAFRSENASTAIPSSLGVNYKTRSIISATPTFSLLGIQPAAPDPTLRAIKACPSPGDNSTAPFSLPFVDLVPFGSARSSSNSGIKSSSSEASNSLFSNIVPHASPSFARPSLEESSLKQYVEALNIRVRQASRPDCKAASTAQLIKCSNSKERPSKRAREDDAVDGATAMSTAGQSCCRFKRSSTEKSCSLRAVAPSLVRPSTTPDVKGLLCLDLELRLGQRSPPADLDGAGTCCRPWTTATAAPR